MYKVIESFKDTDGTIYKVGDEYKNTDKERLKTLSTKENKYGRPFIELVKKARTKKTEKE